MQNIVPIEELDSFISEVIAKVNAGLSVAREAGVTVKMPREIQVSAFVVKKWQVEELEFTTRRETSENGTQGGKTTESQNTGGTEKTTSDEQSNRVDNGENIHQQTTNTDTTYIQ